MSAMIEVGTVSNGERRHILGDRGFRALCGLSVAALTVEKVDGLLDDPLRCRSCHELWWDAILGAPRG